MLARASPTLSPAVLQEIFSVWLQHVRSARAQAAINPRYQMFIPAFEHLGKRGISIPQTSGRTSATEGAGQDPRRSRGRVDAGMSRGAGAQEGFLGGSSGASVQVHCPDRNDAFLAKRGLQLGSTRAALASKPCY